MGYNTYVLLTRLVATVMISTKKEKIMQNNNQVNDFVEDVYQLFDMDLLNNKEKVQDGVVITMQDETKIKVKVKVQQMNLV